MKYLRKIEYKLVREEVSEFNSKQVSSSRDAYSWFKHLENSEVEKFIVVCLDVKNRVVCFDMVGIGSVAQCQVTPREVVKSAILSNASSVILIHNHPSGDCELSKQDSGLTTVLKEACSVFNVSVLDHIIIGDGEYYSFADQCKTIL